jgi:hypothetical protein
MGVCPVIIAERPSVLLPALAGDLLELRLALGLAGDLPEVGTFLDSAWLIIHFFIHQDWQQIR